MDSVEGLSKIYSATSPIDKSPFYKSFTPGFKSSFSATGAVFKEKKSLLAQAFSQKKLDAMEASFMAHTKTLCEVMKAEREMELDEILSALTVDILSDVCFGETFDLLHNPEEKRKITVGLEDASIYVSLVSNEIPPERSKLSLIRSLGRDPLAMAYSPKGHSPFLPPGLNARIPGKGKTCFGSRISNSLTMRRGP